MRLLRVAAALCFLGVATAPALAASEPVKAAVLRSQGTQFTIGTWQYLNSTWPQFGGTPVQIDYWSLAGYHWTVDQIAATDADVLILSDPGFLTYFPEEINAVSQYVQQGHGLIITYGKFRSEDRALAPLVGLSTSISLGTGTAADPIQIDALMPDHPVFACVDDPYTSGTRYNATAYPYSWILDGGTVLGNLFTDALPPRPGIIGNDAGTYRGLYFSYYIETGNQQDMQVLYNAILWAPEPGTACLIIVGAAWLLRRGPAGRRR